MLVHEVMGLTASDDVGRRKTFSNDVLRLEIAGPHQEHLSVIDTWIQSPVWLCSKDDALAGTLPCKDVQTIAMHHRGKMERRRMSISFG